MLKVGDLALFVSVCGAFYGRAQRAIVLVPRSYRHVIEAAIGDACHSYLIHSVSRRTTGTPRVFHSLTRVCMMVLTLSDSMVLFNTRSGFDAFFPANDCGIRARRAAIAPLVIPRLLQLLALLEIAQLVVMRDKQVSTAI